MESPVKRPDPAIAARAIKEAEARKQAMSEKSASAPREIGGRGGEDPARYGDWEIRGIACDF